MGLPIQDLVAATNDNDILHRFFTQVKHHANIPQDRRIDRMNNAAQRSERSVNVNLSSHTDI